MISISHKTKQFGVFIIKLLIVIAAFYFIYSQLANNTKLDWEKFLVLFQKNQSVAGIAFLLFCEYVGKALYFEKKETKRIIFLNLICNGIQVLILGLFGLLSMFVLGYWKWSLLLLASCIALLLISFFTKRILIHSYSIEKFISKIIRIPRNIHQKNIVLGILRYMVLIHQFYFLLVAFDIDLPYLTLITTIATVYLLASIIPSFQFIDFALKGSLAVHFFGLLGVNEWITIFVTALLWILNIVLPVIIGSYYVLLFKFNLEK